MASPPNCGDGTKQGGRLACRLQTLPADDLVMGSQHNDDAERCLAELRERFAKFGLELHQEKAPLIEFGRCAIENREKRAAGRPETFNFLGFTLFHAHLRATPH